jgi:hypothetical protein
MPFKRNEDGTLAMDDSNNPIRVDADGKEYPFGDDALDSTLSNLSKATREATERKHKLRDAETQLKHLEGIEDPEKYFKEANKALETVKNLDDKKLVDAGEVENLKKSIADSYQKKLDEASESVKQKDDIIYNLMVSSQFAKSQALEKTVLTPDIAEAYFGKNFKIEDGQVIGYLGDDKIYSKESPGQLAGFDEALSEIIDKYPMKEKILKAAPGGSGSPSGGGGAPVSGDWHKLSPTERLNAARSGKIK